MQDKIMFTNRLGTTDQDFLLIIAGWHFAEDFYNNLFQISQIYPSLKIFISSHKEKDWINSKINIVKQIKNCEIKFFKNIGFDWGMYSQATNHLSKELSSFKYICFMHDDVKILNNDFLHIFAEYIEKNNLMVLGNCKNLQKTYPRKFKETHLHVIEWGRLSRWKLSIKSDCWNTVRGSCFFVRSGVFQKVKEIPYKTGRTLEFGNWSLILFGGLVADNFGKSSIGYYSTKYLESDLILEYERGYIRDQNNDEKTYTIENFLRNLKRVFSIYFYNPLVFLFKIHSYVNSKLYYKQSDEGLRLNIGRNLAYKDGYLNIDICNSIEADLVIDIKDIALKNILQIRLSLQTY